MYLLFAVVGKELVIVVTKFQNYTCMYNTSMWFEEKHLFGKNHVALTGSIVNEVTTVLL